MAFPRTADGKPLLPGRVSHLLTYDFGWATSVPSDLTTTGGTYVIGGGSGAGALVVTLTTNQAQISLPTVDVTSTSIQAAILTVHGVRCGTSNFPINQYLDFANGATGGVSWSGVALALNGRSGSDTAIPAPIVTGIAGRQMSSTFSLALLPRTKQAAILQGDQVLNAGTFPNMILSSVLTPRITYGFTIGNTVSISKITLEVRTD